jgi:glycosyltransferase involved in cell wall biosynthesis
LVINSPQIRFKPSFSIIIPTLNEEGGIRNTIERIPRSVKECSEILVVDGKSEDKTIVEAEQAGSKVIVVERPGKGFAMRLGAKLAKGKILIFLDGDGTYPSEDIPKFLKAVKQNILVLGNAVPFIKNQKNLLKKIQFLYPSFLLSKHLFFKSGIHLQDPLTGMRAITKDDFERLNLASDGFEIETEMNLKAVSLGMKTVEIPIKISKRKGKSKFIFNFRSHLKILRLLRNKDKLQTSKLSTN